MQKVEHTVLDHESSERIDKVISNLNSDWSRTQAQQWIKGGHVLVNDQQIKTNYKCSLNDLIEIIDSRTRNTRCYYLKKWIWIFIMKILM